MPSEAPDASFPAEIPPARPGLPRAAEALIALFGLLIASPLLIAAAIAIRVSSPGPVLYRQERMGRAGHAFTMLKLRTMRPDAAGPPLTARRDPRVTPVGAWLRRTKLDELPQLWNVLRGEMSLVGPRPEVSRYADLQDPMWQRVLEVRPGITDPLTLELRDEERLMPEDPAARERFYLETLQPAKLRGYVEYLSRRSGWTDVRVVAATLWALARPRRGDENA